MGDRVSGRSRNRVVDLFGVTLSMFLVPHIIPFNLPNGRVGLGSRWKYLGTLLM